MLDKISNTQIVGTGTGQTPWFLQQINCKEMFKKEEKDNPRRYLREKLVSVSDWASLELIPTIFKNYSHETTRILNSD